MVGDPHYSIPLPNGHIQWLNQTDRLDYWINIWTKFYCITWSLANQKSGEVISKYNGLLYNVSYNHVSCCLGVLCTVFLKIKAHAEKVTGETSSAFECLQLSESGVAIASLCINK